LLGFICKGILGTEIIEFFDTIAAVILIRRNVHLSDENQRSIQQKLQNQKLLTLLASHAANAALSQISHPSPVSAHHLVMIVLAVIMIELIADSASPFCHCIIFHSNRFKEINDFLLLVFASIVLHYNY
jgi:hypothetical protein